MTDNDTKGNIGAGIDEGKADPALSIAAGAATHFANAPDGIAALELARQSVDLTVYEPAGGYERPRAEALYDTGAPALPEPAGGNRPHGWLDLVPLRRGHRPVGSEAAERVDVASDVHGLQSAEWQDLRRREQLVKQRTQEKNRQDKGQSAGALASALRHIAWLDAEITSLKEYQTLMQNVPALAQAADWYRSVPGVRLLTAATLMADLPGLGRCDGKGLAGLAPWAR